MLRSMSPNSKRLYNCGGPNASNFTEMPSKAQVTLKSIPPISNALTLTQAMSNDSSDDDFQNPSQAISLTQNLIFSSFQNPTLQPLKPSSFARPQKKAKAASSGMKENSKIRKTPKEPVLDVGGSHRKAAENPISQPLKPYNAAGTPKEPKQVASVGKENSKIMQAGGGSVVDFEVSTECGNGNGIGSRSMYLLNSIEWRLLQSGAVCGSAVGNGCSLKKPKLGEAGSINDCESMVEPDADFGIHGCNGEKMLNVESGYFLNSIESKFVEQAIESVGVREDNFGDFEPGTQLNELVNLCSEMDEGENLSRGVLVEGDIGANAENLSSSVECPLCGADISDLSEESRQLHTNDCLDRDETSKVIIPSDKMVTESPQQQVVDVSPVLEWLRILGLSRYEEAFIKEEIDWDTLQWLSEEDLLSIGIAALGPRKKIVHALNELRRNMHGHDLTTDSSRTTTDENKKVVVPGNKLITEFFRGPSAVDKNRMSAPPGACHRVESSSKSGHNRAAVRHRANNGKVRDIPPWCCIPGTPFRVDAFRYLRRDCSHWFLTHFHLDHYQGLTRGFCHGKIYCSSITARLVNMKIGVPWDRLQVLPLNQKISIAGIYVTFLDANHCPGSVVILFEPPNNKAVLHTGDFRFSDEMTSMPLFQSCSIHTLILDTTYCSPQYDFPKQEAVIQFVVDAIQAEAFNPKTLFLIGSYTIGKERLFLEVARCLHKKIYVGAAKLQLLQCLELPEEDMQWFTLNEHESHIHVVPMWTIASFKRMKYISNQYLARFNLIVAFSPTGWTFGKGKKKSPGRRWQQGTIIRYEVPYSEHCSFTELREFVQFVSPENIIPSVNNNGPETADAMIALLMSDS